MAKSKGSLIPMRGSVENWGPGKYQRNLERKEAYARKMQEQAAKGSPDFGKLLGTGVVGVAKKAKAAKKPAAAAKKKSSQSSAKRSSTSKSKSRRH